MMSSSSERLRQRSGVAPIAGRVAVTVLALSAQFPAHAQRYAEDDYSGSLNIVIWVIAIAVFIFMWLRKRVRHLLNPKRAAAEDEAAEEKRLAEMKALDAEMERMARIDKANRDR